MTREETSSPSLPIPEPSRREVARMAGFWRWAGAAVLLAFILVAFAVLDKTALHWYVPEDADTPGQQQAGAPLDLTSFEARAIALSWVEQNFGSLDGYACEEPEFNDSRARWTAVCTELAAEGADVKVISVDAVTGLASELVSQ